MKRLVLIRDIRTAGEDKNAVKGILLVTGKDSIIMRVKENILYLLNEGNYRLHYEYSPKFKRNLWEVKGTYPRSEIKIHVGDHSSHSEGCILAGSDKLNQLHRALDSKQNYLLTIINV